MYVVQLLLPLFDNEGQPFPDTVMAEVRERLVSRFGGVTAFSRTPAEGVWSSDGRRVHDDIILVEVMAAGLDRTWWGEFRRQMESQLRQEAIIVRAHAVDQL